MFSHKPNFEEEIGELCAQVVTALQNRDSSQI